MNIKTKTIIIYSIIHCCFITTNVSAQDMVYKCTDNQGNVTYLNGSPSKAPNSSCNKTELGNIEQYPTVSNTSKTKNIISNPNIGSGNNGIVQASMMIKDPEQIIRDTKRQLVLNRELENEKEQLSTVVDMLKKVSSQDIEQSNQLKEMEATHQRNIGSLEKELGIKKEKQPILLNVVNTKNDEKTPKPEIKFVSPSLNNENILQTKKITTNMLSQNNLNKKQIKNSQFAPVPKFIPKK